MELSDHLIALVNETVFLTLTPEQQARFKPLRIDRVKEAIKSKPINLVGLITGEGELLMDMRIRQHPGGKLAACLNLLLLDHFESLQEFFDTFGLTREYIHLLWTSVVITPPKQTIIRLVKEYKINPRFIHGNMSNHYIEYKSR